MFLGSVDNTFESDETPLHFRSTETHLLWNDAKEIWEKASL